MPCSSGARSITDRNQFKTRRCACFRYPPNCFVAGGIGGLPLSAPEVSDRATAAFCAFAWSDCVKHALDFDC